MTLQKILLLYNIQTYLKKKLRECFFNDFPFGPMEKREKPMDHF